MNNKKDLTAIIISRMLVIFFLGIFSTSHAAMIDNGNGTITDTDTGLMWLKNSDNGTMTWTAANTWANGLTFAGHSDWRLPSALNRGNGALCNSQPSGANCPDTEFGTLYFGYGITNLVNSGVFQNFSMYRLYWTATEFPSDTTKAMTQDFNDGGQNPWDKNSNLNAWAVRSTSATTTPLVDNGDGTIVDTVQCLTWVKDATLACTLAGPGSGNACWFYSAANAQDWANNLNYAGYDDWRIPNMPNGGRMDSELEYLLYGILNNPAGGPPTNTGPFINVLQTTPFTTTNDAGAVVTIDRVHKRYWLNSLIFPGNEPAFNIEDQTYDDYFMLDGQRFSAWVVRNGCDIIPPQCNDGIDNDSDGLIDTADPGCENATDRDESGGLVDNGDGTISDYDVCLMWSKDANPAGNHMSLENAETYVSNFNLVGHNDWRLPSAMNFDGSGPCISLSGIDVQCNESELGHLYYDELGNEGGGPLANVGLFTNLDPLNYWTSTSVTSGWGIEFGFLTGSQSNILATVDNRAWPVRDIVDVARGCAAKPQCNDGIDNDGDGLIDYPSDGGCCSNTDNSEGRRFSNNKLIPKFVELEFKKLDGIQIFKQEYQREYYQLEEGLLQLLRCWQIAIPDYNFDFDRPICLQGPITTGQPLRCPGLDCLIDGPGCMEPYPYRRVAISEKMVVGYAQWLGRKTNDKVFKAQLTDWVKSGEIIVDKEPPTRKRYRKEGLSLQGIALMIVALIVGLFVGRRFIKR